MFWKSVRVTIVSELITFYVLTENWSYVVMGSSKLPKLLVLLIYLAEEFGN